MKLISKLTSIFILLLFGFTSNNFARNGKGARGSHRSGARSGHRGGGRSMHRGRRHRGGARGRHHGRRTGRRYHRGYKRGYYGRGFGLGFGFGAPYYTYDYYPRYDYDYGYEHNQLQDEYNNLVGKFNNLLKHTKQLENRAEDLNVSGYLEKSDRFHYQDKRYFEHQSGLKRELHQLVDEYNDLLDYARELEEKIENKS